MNYTHELVTSILYTAIPYSPVMFLMELIRADEQLNLANAANFPLLDCQTGYN